MSRNYHALTTKYNVLYNGQIGYDKGMIDIRQKSTNNFWKRLPVEKMQWSDDGLIDTVKNANFDLAETKATKAIQKHSMNIGGRERNAQTDEAYLMLGKSRYYSQRFLPALDAFNYILYKYSNSDKIHEAKIWREKTNMRLGNDAIAIKNLSKLLEDDKLKKQTIANANAVLAEAFLNLEQKDSAIVKLEIAEKFTKINNEKARYHFILGQLQEEKGNNSEALSHYQTIIDMNRKPDREYRIQAFAKKAQLFDFQNGNKAEMEEIFQKWIENRENRPYLGVIYHQIGVFHEKNNDPEKALKNYNLALKNVKEDNYLAASSYRNIANMYFKKPDFSLAAKYYDSTLVKLDNKTREFFQIEKNRKNLDEVIKYEAISKQNDSILNLVSLSENDRIAYFGTYIENLQKADAKKKLIEDSKQNGGQNNAAASSLALQSLKNKETTPTTLFYFYNPTTVAFGQLEFKKIWGKRTVNGYWRTATSSFSAKSASTNAVSDTTKVQNTSISDSDKYNVAFYVNQIPTDKKILDSISKERNQADYQLGIIYKEKFKEYALAAAKLEKVLLHEPEEKMILPSLYNLYKIYQITDAEKAIIIKNRIISNYPNSRYAQIISNSNNTNSIETPETIYNNFYKMFEAEEFVSLLEKLQTAIVQQPGEEILPKFELLLAHTKAKLFGLIEYKNALTALVEHYPNTEEGKKAQDILTTQIPILEKMDFTFTEAKSWKIIYQVGQRDDQITKEIEEKINKFIADEKIEKRSYSFDVYNDKQNFMVIHNIKSEAYANDVLNYMAVHKEYTIHQPAIIISSDNYKVVQIHKNLTRYLAAKKP